MLALRLQTVSKVAVVVAILMGLGMIALGALFIALGTDARSDIRSALIKEQIVTSQDASIPGVEVRDAAGHAAENPASRRNTGTEGATRASGATDPS